MAKVYNMLEKNLEAQDTSHQYLRKQKLSSSGLGDSW